MKKPTLKTVIIDDEIQSIKLLSGMAAEIPEILVTGTFTDPVQALLGIREIEPDLLFLDIQMPRMNGIELLRGVRNAGLSPWVIFITAYDQFALDAIHQEAFDYLLKPISPKELEESVQRLYSRFNTDPANPFLDHLLNTSVIQKLRFTDRNGTTFINPAEIVYVEAEGNYSIFHMKAKQHMVTRQIGELEVQLQPIGFIRISRSFIINPLYLSRIDRKLHICLLEVGDQRFELPVSEDRLRDI
jgi:DNA-binding LytR/AlgR family response regulator